MYKQSINNIKVIIIPLDGTILNLNRLRYNYYHHLCDRKHIDLDIQTFYSHLSSMYDMYKGLPLSHNVDTGPLNAKIERELLQYLKYKKIEPKEGLLELIEYLHQKNIQIAIMSTHRTKDTVEYLQMLHLYHDVHFIIGSDTTSLPLPSTQILETIAKHFGVMSNEVLVLSSFMSLNHAAHKLHMNIIYCEDLISAGKEEKATSFKIAHNLYEVLNILLFDQYEEVEMYSPILGMNSQMSREELVNVKAKLRKRYQNDEQILEVIDKTYDHYISQLNQQNIKDGSLFIHENPTKKKFQFIDETLDEQISENDNDDSIEDIVIEEVTMSHESPPLSSLDANDEEELLTLLQQINYKEKQMKTPLAEENINLQNNEQPIEEQIHKHEEINDYDESSKLSISSFFVNFFYILSVSFLILFIGLIIYIAFIHQFETNKGIFPIITTIFNGYYGLIESILKLIFNSFHSIIAFIPSYSDYMQHNIIFSVDGMRIFNLYLFQTFIIVIIKIIITVINKRSSNHENDD